MAKEKPEGKKNGSEKLLPVIIRSHARAQKIHPAGA